VELGTIRTAGHKPGVGANLRSVHLLLDGRLLKTLPSRYHPEQLVRLAQLPGAQPAGRRQGHRLSA
jgi:hypothetical protein